MGIITLENVRATSDITVKVRLKDGGVYIDWSTLTDLKAYIFSDAQRAMAGRCSVDVDENDGTLLVCEYSANKPQYLGVNRIVVQGKYRGRMKTYDKAAFNVVSRTHDSAGDVVLDDPVVDLDLEVADVSSSILDTAILAAIGAADRANEAAEAAEHMVDIHTGPEGKSAYEVAVEEGYTGTEEEWLASLEGPVGATPDITIGTVTTVEPGTPAAATMTGTPEAPVLNLTIPKGVAGDTPAFTVGEVTTGQPGTPVVVTITGTAAAPVLNIQIPQGLQGNTGSSVDYPYELVNNLTTNDATKGLSAAQGKVLKDDITQLEHKENMFNPLFVTDTEITDFSGYTKKDYIVVSGGVYGTASSSKHIEIPVKPGQRVRIVSHTTNGTRFAFYWDLDHPGSGAVTPYVTINGGESVLLSANTETIVTVPDGAGWLIVNVGSTTTPYTPQSIEIMESKEETAKKQLTTATEYEGENLENPNTLKANWCIDSRDGRIQRISSSTKGCTDYIPVKGGDLLCQNPTTSGTYGKHAVYDENKNFLRSFSGGNYTYQSGDYYTRWTVSIDGVQKVITRTTTYGTPRNVAYESPLVQTIFDDNTLAIKKNQIPDLFPACSLVGEPGKVVTVASLTNDSITITDAPSKLKPNAELSFYGKITSFGYVEFGCGKGNNTGWGVRVNGTNVSAVAYNNGSTVAVDTKAHGLTIGTFIYVAIVKVGKDINVKITSFGGEYVGTVSLNVLEAYGVPFAYADGDTSLTAVKFGWVAKDLRNAIWFFGASYCSLYQNRMLTQLRDTYGVSNFAIVAEAGNDFEAIMPALTNALNFGTPKYLVCGIGMNETYPEVYSYYFKKLKNLCKSRGIEFIPCTIPWPENGTKSEINNIVKNSGCRYIDLYASVSSDENGTWYPGYCDDGVHPTLIGAKAMAARIMLDLPEILEY